MLRVYRDAVWVTRGQSFEGVVMDVVVWSESAEREAWWRGILAITADEQPCATTSVKTVPEPARVELVRGVEPRTMSERSVDAA